MLKVTRIKKTQQIVHVVGNAGSNHSFVLFPFTTKTRKGDWGKIQRVRNDNIVHDRPELA